MTKPISDNYAEARCSETKFEKAREGLFGWFIFIFIFVGAIYLGVYYWPLDHTEEIVLPTPSAHVELEKPELEKPTRLVKIKIPVDFEFDPYYYSWKEVRGADWYEYAFEGFSVISL